MNIWAHRGCSSKYPENTLEAFEAAVKLAGLTGIELDIQLTADGQMVVFHDETVDRTTDGTGMLHKYTLKELKQLMIPKGNGAYATVPTIREVLDLLEPKLKSGLLLNIELKTSAVRYVGIERWILDEIERRGLNNAIIYSSFWADSVELIRKLNPKAGTGMLGEKLTDCAKWDEKTHADALHPFASGLDMTPEQLKGRIVRVWNSEPLYPNRPSEQPIALERLKNAGVTDIFTNEPERYL